MKIHMIYILFDVRDRATKLCCKVKYMHMIYCIVVLLYDVYCVEIGFGSGGWSVAFFAW